MEILNFFPILADPSRMESLLTMIKDVFYLKISVVTTSVGVIPELIINN